MPEPESSGRIVAFLSDYGLADEFVGVCKAVVHGVAPDVTFVDLTHDIPAHDVKAGALALVRAVQYLPGGCILLAVVDPGVGTQRRLLGVECEHVTMLGPDNGLLAPAAAMSGGARRVVSLTSDEYRLPAPGPTFAGRDILAPAAGYLALRASTSRSSASSSTRAASSPAWSALSQREEDGALEAEVWWVDRFGNCQLNLGPDELEAAGGRRGERVEVRFAEDAPSRRAGSRRTRTRNRPSSCCSSTRTGCSRSRSTANPPRRCATSAPAPR